MTDTAPIHIVPIEAGPSAHVPDRVCACSPRAMRRLDTDSIVFVHRWTPQPRVITYNPPPRGRIVDDDDGDAA